MQVFNDARNGRVPENEQLTSLQTSLLIPDQLKSPVVEVETLLSDTFAGLLQFSLVNASFFQRLSKLVNCHKPIGWTRIHDREIKTDSKVRAYATQTSSISFVTRTTSHNRSMSYQQPPLISPTPNNPTSCVPSSLTNTLRIRNPSPSPRTISPNHFTRRTS